LRRTDIDVCEFDSLSDCFPGRFDIIARRFMSTIAIRHRTRHSERSGPSACRRSDRRDAPMRRLSMGRPRTKHLETTLRPHLSG
jgi:hypothetical protein